MATRSRLTWKPESRGYDTRHICWERTKSGKLQQHKFLLGTDRKEAERREPPRAVGLVREDVPGAPAALA